jgi:membrane-bound ClpP family serine protease
MIALGASVAAVPILIKLFGKSRLIQRIVLSHAETVANGYVHTRTERDLTGQTGVALTDLRPAGLVRIGSERVDALTEGGYIARGTPVTVVHMQGTKVFVTTATNQNPAHDREAPMDMPLNILFILADDQGPWALNCAGHPSSTRRT